MTRPDFELYDATAQDIMPSGLPGEKGDWEEERACALFASSVGNPIHPANTRNPLTVEELDAIRDGSEFSSFAGQYLAELGHRH